MALIFRYLPLLLVLFVLSLKGTIVPSINLEALSQQSDVIVIGKVVNSKRLADETVDVEGLRVRCLRMRAEVEVEQYLKGDTGESKLTFLFDLPIEPIGYRGIGINDRGLFSFVRTPNGTLHLFDPYHPYLVASRIPLAAGAPVYHRVILAVEQVAIEQRQPEGDRLEALHELGSVSDERELSPLQILLKDENQRVMAIAASLLISVGNAGAFRAIEPRLVKGNGLADPFAVHAVSLATANFLKSSEAIPEVDDLLKNGNAELRAAAALALRSIGARESVQPLLNALDDVDYDVRFNSTLALTSITAQYQLGALEPDFHKHETQIIAAWKQWGTENGFKVARHDQF